MKGDKMKLYYMPGRISMAPHILINEYFPEELDLRLVNLHKQEQNSQQFLEMNPNARVPHFIHEHSYQERLGFMKTSLSEAAAICEYIYSLREEGFWHPMDHLQWMFYLSNTVQETMNHWLHPDWFVHDEVNHFPVRQMALEKLEFHHKVLANHIKDSKYMCGIFGPCDAYLFTLLHWHTIWKNHIPPLMNETLLTWYNKMKTRPSIVKTMETENDVLRHLREEDQKYDPHGIY